MAKASTEQSSKQDGVQPICGIIMPISAMPPIYDAAHWIDVRRVIDAAVKKAGMLPQIVSDSFEGDVIQQRIISNLYDNPVVVCDVSGLNPNVMFELGMRLTFKKPVIIITDDFATIPFDTKVIEHLGYPRDLHIHQTNEFIEKLAEKIGRLLQQQRDGSFRSFIEAFGTFEVLEPTKKVVEADQLILDRLDQIERRLARNIEHIFPASNRFSPNEHARKDGKFIELIIEFKSNVELSDMRQLLDFLERNYRSKSGQLSKAVNGYHIARIDLFSDQFNDVQVPAALLHRLPAHLRETIKDMHVSLS